MLNFLFKLVKFIERLGHYFQGKGYGTSTLNQEFTLLSSFLDAKPNLVIDIGGNVGDCSESISVSRNTYLRAVKKKYRFVNGKI